MKVAPVRWFALCNPAGLNNISFCYLILSLCRWAIDIVERNGLSFISGKEVNKCKHTA